MSAEKQFGKSFYGLLLGIDAYMERRRRRRERYLRVDDIPFEDDKW